MSTIKQTKNFAGCILLSSIEHGLDKLISMQAAY